jgi:hypothetical protein
MCYSTKCSPSSEGNKTYPGPRGENILELYLLSAFMAGLKAKAATDTYIFGGDWNFLADADEDRSRRH